jgi:hypothetical protein
MNTILIFLLLFIILEIPISYGWGLIFKKLGLEFNKGIIPFYNKIILINEFKMPQYHLILIFIPVVGMYTNYLIYTKLVRNNKMDDSYIVQLTFFPFVYNIFLGVELKQKTPRTPNQKVENYFEDQKNIYDIDLPDEEPKQDEYVWHPKKNIKSNTVYKAERNKLNAKVNIKQSETNEIIDTKRSKKSTEEETTKTCINCGAKLKSTEEVCHICGTKQ